MNTANRFFRIQDMKTTSEYSDSPHKAKQTDFRGHFASGFCPSTDGNERLCVGQSGAKWVTLEMI
jgi:hypothetical protein